MANTLLTSTELDRRIAACVRAVELQVQWDQAIEKAKAPDATLADLQEIQRLSNLIDPPVESLK